jgi:type IV secretory pathway VirB2 component (pilin)
MTKIISKNFAKIALLSFLAIAIMPTLINSFSSAALADAADDKATCEKATHPACAPSITIGTCVSNGSKCVWAPESKGNAFEATICNLLSLITGTGGKAFAAFAIISVGIGFFTGKVSWGLMIGVAAGIAAIFGAPSVVAAIAGGDAVNPESCKKAVAV